MNVSKKYLVLSVFLLLTILFTTAISVKADAQDTVRVWVTYQSGRKAEVFQTLTRENASVHYDFPELEAYVVSMPAAALNGILRNPFVTAVENDPERYPVEPVRVHFNSQFEDALDFNGQTIPWGIDAVQAREVWDPDGNTVVEPGTPSGEGRKVCIIDTGYYADHEDLLDKVDGVTGISQVDDDWTRDGYGHGTHVAGTISALNNDYGVVGVSPGMVDLHIVKIFDDAGAWVSKAHASDLTAAIYECQSAGANVISMSLSGSGSNTKEQQAFDELYAAGILHVAAAGNHQVEEPGVLHYPASYESVIAVAALDANLSIADFSAQNEPVELAAPGVGVLSTLPYIETNSVTVDGTEYKVNHTEYAAYGTANGTLVDGGLCTATGDWAGNVVLCSRGTNDFYQKTMNVQNSGGVAAVIYNNVENEDLYATLGEGNTSEIISVSTTMENGLAMLGKVGLPATVSSVLEKPGNGYEAWGGTSMATPHVAGVAALIWSANPDWTNEQVREAMTMTALDLGDDERDIAFGFGLVQAVLALDYLEELTPPPPTEDELVVTITSPEHAAQFTDRDTVPIEIFVTDGVNPVEGAAVTVTIESTQFKPQTLKGTTAADGTVSFDYKVIVRKTGNGQYALSVTADKDGYQPGTAESIFTVY